MTALIQRVLFQCSISFLIVEHDTLVIMNILDKILDKIMVRNFGRKNAEGMPVQLQGNEAVVAVIAVIAAYLGTSHGVAVAN